MIGDTYMAINKENKNQVAIKIIKIENDIKMKNLIENELLKLKTIIKVNILIEALMDNNYIYLVMNLFDDNLENILYQRNSGLSYDEIKNIIKDINIAFNELNREHIIHGDLKLSNILIKYIGEEKIYDAILTDYYLNKMILGSKNIIKNEFYYLFISPEIINIEEKKR